MILRHQPAFKDHPTDTNSAVAQHAQSNPGTHGESIKAVQTIQSPVQKRFFELIRCLFNAREHSIRLFRIISRKLRNKNMKMVSKGFHGLTEKIPSEKLCVHKTHDCLVLFPILMKDQILPTFPIENKSGSRTCPLMLCIHTLFDRHSPIPALMHKFRKPYLYRFNYITVF